MQGDRHADSDGVSIAGTLRSYAGFTQLSGDGWVLQQCAGLPHQALDAGGRSRNESPHLLEYGKCSECRLPLEVP